MSRNFGLDVVRAVSIWFVMVQHGGYNIPGLEPLKIGAVGVEIFFVLSGFLIGGIIFRDIDKKKTFWATLKHFWIRRWYRILPLYYLAILFKFFVIDSSVGANIIYYLLFLQNNFYGISFYGVTWSLVIEEWFYLFTPIFLISVSRLLKTNRLMNIALITFLIVVNIARIVYVELTDAPFQGVNGNFPFRFDALFLGVALAFLKHNGYKLYKKLENPLVFTAGLMGLIGYLYIYWTWANPVNEINQMWFPRTMGFFVLPFTIALLIPYAARYQSARQNSIAGKAWYWWVTKTSLYTYAIYLAHTLLFKITMKNDFPIEGNFFRMLIGIALSYMVAALLYKFFERPILDYRDRKVKR